MVIYDRDIKALPLRFWHPLNKHPHILQFWDSVKSIHLLLLILAVLECAPDAFLKGEEMTRKQGTVCHRDIKKSILALSELILNVLFQENKFFLVMVLIIVNYFTFSHREWITLL